MRLSDAEQIKHILRILDEISSERIKETRQAYMQDIDGMFEVDFDPLDFILLNDLSTDKTIVYSRPLEKIVDISPTSLLSLCDKDERNTLNDSVTPSRFIYDPYNLVPFCKESNGHYEFVRVNLYNPPEWLRNSEKRRSDVPTSFSTIIQEFFDHLFLDKESQIYAINWLHYALTQRNETYLVLNGMKGSGKGLFCELAKMLVGASNYGIANESLLTKEFNSVLDNKRLVNYDEQKIGKSEHTRLKRYINKHQNIEKKGVDADEVSEIFNSYIVTNNDVGDMYLEPDDRRFSVLEITEKPLKSVWSKIKIEHFSNMIESDKNFAEEFGLYIYNYRDSNFDVHAPFVGRTFFNLCYYSLKIWQRYLVDKALTGDKDVWTLRELKRGVSEEAGFNNKYFPSNAERVNDFIKNYLYEGEHKIGKLRKDAEDGWVLDVNPKFLEDSEEEITSPKKGSAASSIL